MIKYHYIVYFVKRIERPEGPSYLKYFSITQFSANCNNIERYQTKILCKANTNLVTLRECFEAVNS